MNIYMIIGILITVLGNFLILILGNRKNFIVYGIIINALGLGFLTVSPIISANKDKKEIIDKISEVRKEIGVIKTATKNKDSLGKIEKVENEFNEWADSFVRNLEGKKVEQKKAFFLLAERE